ncbi:hypothetical protein ACQ9BO_19210 [Flavobacterium sp. P21]|uniref:hypothetical protein n=1 Tax=Flavobacterium sp. P21 TaxID=3423948 RepID=UPI003D67D310
MFRRNIKILNAADNVIAKIYGNKKDLCFDITNSAENKIGEIKQREDSIRSRIKYDSIIDEIYSEVDDKIAILASVFAINMFF